MSLTRHLNSSVMLRLVVGILTPTPFASTAESLGFAVVVSAGLGAETVVACGVLVSLTAAPAVGSIIP